MSIDEFLSTCKLPRIPTRPHKYLDISNIDRNLIESVITHGVVCPIIVDKDYYIIDGVKRYIILRHLRSNNIKLSRPVPVLRLVDESFTEKPISALHIAYMINMFRAPPVEEEFSEELLTYIQDITYKIWEIYNKDYEKTARHLGFSIELVKKLIEEYLRSLVQG